MLSFKSNDKIDCYFRLLILEKNILSNQRLVNLLSLLLKPYICLITELL